MSDTEKTDGRTGRVISTIQFPYVALDDAIALARKLLDAGGIPMDRDQLAAVLGTAPSGGTFAVKLSALRMFGLMDTDAQGRFILTERGFEILEPSRERVAKADAFLSVDLFRAVYEQYKGRQLPPRPIGLENALVSLGVSPKQKDRARSMLDRSARLAGFFPTQAEDRLVAPIIGTLRAGGDIIGRMALPNRDELSAGDPVEAPAQPPTIYAIPQPSPQLDGVITALIGKLPPTGKPFTSTDRKKWLTMMEMALEMAYGAEDEAGA